MRKKFSSYGPIVASSEFHAPRIALIDKVHKQLIGENIDEGGHYFTVWAPRQTGKTWILQNALWRIQKDERFYVAKINLEALKEVEDVGQFYSKLAADLNYEFQLGIPNANSKNEFEDCFTNQYLKKPLILILDEFDALEENVINTVVSSFRDMFVFRKDQTDKKATEKKYLLHSVALIGVRSVVGIENVKGSPFNVQRSVHIPNLTFDEVKQMYNDYQQEYNQKIDADVIEQIYYETNGQPGLVSWLGELMTEKYNENIASPITNKEWKKTYLYASQAEPNNTIMNLISKANQLEYKEMVLKLFNTENKTPFKFDQIQFNFLYMNGVITFEIEEDEKTGPALYAKFSCPFVQKRLFDRFCNEYFEYIGRPYDPTLELDDIFLETELKVYPLLKLYEVYLQNNKHWINKNIPIRTDGRFHETFYHFNFFRWLFEFLTKRDGYVIPEFPTGNGKIDLIVNYADKKYALELKSFGDSSNIKKAIIRSAQYGKQLKINEIYLIYFYDFLLPKEKLEKYEKEVLDLTTNVLVKPVFLYLDR